MIVHPRRNRRNVAINIAGMMAKYLATSLAMLT